MKLKNILPILIFSLLLFAGCDTLPGSETNSGMLTISGVVEAVEVAVAPEFGGRVAEVFASEGDQVNAGDALIKFEDGLLQAQRNQAVAAFESAQANLNAAFTNLEAAKDAVNAAEIGVHAANVQYQLQVAGVRFAEVPERDAAWAIEPSDEFEVPVWYFTKLENIAAADAAVAEAMEALDLERANFEEVTMNASNAELTAAETQLAEAQAAFLVAETLFNREVQTTNEVEISDYLQDIYDTALAELDAAQLAFDQILSDESFAEILEARARLAAAQEMYEIALDQRAGLQTGQESLELEAGRNQILLAESGVSQAETGVRLAEAAVGQAEAIVNEASAALEVFDAQIEQLTVYAPVSGIVLVRNSEPGEILAPGASALTIAKMEALTVTVYVPENQYGNINVNDTASVTTDSFPGLTFEAKVVRIADRAEFTPRNVQTSDDRSTTVYAIELSVGVTNGKFKPGMPVDVEFDGN